MTDICKCNGEKESGEICPQREKCYRYTSESDEYLQTWMEAPFNGELCHCLINLGKGK